MPGLGKSFGRYAVITTQYSQLPRYRYRWVNRKGKRKRAIVCEPVISAYPNSGEKKVAQPTRHRSSAERTGQFAGLVCAPSPRIVRGFNCALRRARRKKRASSRLEGSPFLMADTRARERPMSIRTTWYKDKGLSIRRSCQRGRGKKISWRGGRG